MTERWSLGLLVTAGILATACGGGGATASSDGRAGATFAVEESTSTDFVAERAAADESIRIVVRFTPTTTLYWMSSSTRGVLLLEGTEKLTEPPAFADGFNGNYVPALAGSPLYSALGDVHERLLALGASERPGKEMQGSPMYAAAWMTAQMLGKIPDIAPSPEEVQSPAALNAWLGAHRAVLEQRAWPVPGVDDMGQVEKAAAARPITAAFQPGNNGSCGGNPLLDYCCGYLNCRDGNPTNQAPCGPFGICPANCGTECAAGDLCFWMFGSSLANTRFTINGQSLPLCGTPFDVSHSWFGGSCPHADAYVFAANGSARNFINNNRPYAASSKCCNGEAGCQKP